MAARSAAYENEMIISEQDNYPYEFLAAVAHGAEDQLAEIEEDLRGKQPVDERTEYLMKTKRDGATTGEILKSDLLRAEVRLILRLKRICVGTVEHGHASMQRLRLAKAHHTAAHGRQPHGRGVPSKPRRHNFGAFQDDEFHATPYSQPKRVGLSRG